MTVAANLQHDLVIVVNTYVVYFILIDKTPKKYSENILKKNSSYYMTKNYMLV